MGENMPRSVNKVVLVGHLGRDPEMRYTGAGVPVARFSVATSRQWRDPQSNEQREETEWHEIVCWRGVAEVAGQYLAKGRQVYLEGEIRTNSWEKDGQTRERKEIHVRDLVLLGSGGGEYSGARRDTSNRRDDPSESRGNNPPKQNSPRRQTANPVNDDDAELDDDIPF